MSASFLVAQEITEDNIRRKRGNALFPKEGKKVKIKGKEETQDF